MREGGIGAKWGLRRNFMICPSSCHISKTMGNNDKMGAPTASGNQRHPPGYEQGWCKGFKNGYGLLRPLRMRQYHALKEKRKLESEYDEMTCTIHEQSSTFQFIENQAQLLGDFLDSSIGELNDKGHWDMIMEPQDEGVLLNDVDLGPGEDQPHDATTGSQNHDTFEFDFHINHMYSSA